MVFGLCRTLEFAMLLLSSKTFLACTMRSRFFIFIIFRSYKLFHSAFIVVNVLFFQMVVIPNFLFVL